MGAVPPAPAATPHFREVRSPHTGSLRFAYDFGIPDLRAWDLKRFPYVIFYMALGDRIDIWRVLHTSRDILGTLVEVVPV